MKRILLSACCLLMVFLGKAQEHHWVPVQNFENTMDGVGIVILDGVEQQSGELELGIFCGDECRGSVFPEQEGEHWLYYFSMGGVAGESFTFRLYDHSVDTELDVSYDNEVPFVINDFLGDFDAPYELAFTTNSTPEPTGVVITLKPGWNWISYLLEEETPIEEALMNLTPSEGDMIKSQDGNSSFSNGQWNGSITKMIPGYGYIYRREGETTTFTYPKDQ